MKKYDNRSDRNVNFRVFHKKKVKQIDKSSMHGIKKIFIQKHFSTTVNPHTNKFTLKKKTDVLHIRWFS